MEKLALRSIDLVKANLAKLEALFPQAVVEVQGENGLEKKLDVDALQALLGGEILTDRGGGRTL